MWFDTTQFHTSLFTLQSNCAEGLHFSAFHYYCCACSKTSISINKYMQKAGEPENDAGFLKHYSQLNCSYSYPSKPRLVVTVFLARPYDNCACELTRALHVH